MQENKTRLTFVGHATVLIELDGTRVLTDPLLRDRALHLRRRGAAINSDWHTNIDAALISHTHIDHFDFASLRKLDKNTPVIAPLGAGDDIRRLGFAHVREVSAGESVRVGAVRLTATRAAHIPTPRVNAPPIECLGFVVEGSRRVYFAGDTDLFDEMRDLRGQIDAALLPIWGWGPRLGRGHLTPRTAAQAAEIINPRVAVPIHWGTLHPVGIGWMQPAYLREPGMQFKRETARLAPLVDVRVLEVGESTVI